MTGATCFLVCAAFGLAGLCVPAALADAPDSPWWLVAIVVPLGAFAAWLVRWILSRQDAMHAENLAREVKRETREEKRAEHAELQTKAMQDCVAELRRLGTAIDQVPERVVELLDERESA